MLRKRKDKHEVRAGDVFLLRRTDEHSKTEPELFLVQKANTFVYLAGSGGHGHSGRSVTRSNLGRRTGRPFAITLAHIVGYKYMNKMIEDGEAVRLAHYDDLAEADAAVRAWGDQSVDVLEVPVPGTLVAPKLVAIAGGQS